MVGAHPEGAVDMVGENHGKVCPTGCWGNRSIYSHPTSAPSWFLTYVSNVSSDYFS